MTSSSPYKELSDRQLFALDQEITQKSTSNPSQRRELLHLLRATGRSRRDRRNGRG